MACRSIVVSILLVCVLFVSLKPLTTIVVAQNNFSSGWQSAQATWYGAPNGDGTDGGACGYGILAGGPYGSDVAAASPVLYKNGEGCGACYLVACTDATLCSSTAAVTIVITDECPGCGGAHLFDLSGSAFQQMASSPTLSSNLLDVGVAQVVYKRVPCNYPHAELTIRMNQGATDYWFSTLVEYVNGDGEISKVELLQNGAQEWQQMERLWGAYWCVQSGGALQGPFSVRVTTSPSGSTFTSMNVVPANWSPGVSYTSNGNLAP